MRENTTLIAGPTASGKSALALRIAKERDAIIVNADSMQVYDVLRVLTARPNVTEMDGVTHKLYGHVNPAQLYSMGSWLADVEALLDNAAFAGRHIVFVGGTGLYFKALLGGMSEMPLVPDDIRSYWRSQLEAVGPEALHCQLAVLDPEAATRLKPQDGQRIVRAFEVLAASGKPISYWQKQTGRALIDRESSKKICLVPDRDKLRAKIDQRFAQMMNNGAIDEVRVLATLQLDVALPAMKAIGVREIMAHLEGQMTINDVIKLASAATRQYAKRQVTWMRHQFDADWERITVW